MNIFEHLSNYHGQWYNCIINSIIVIIKKIHINNTFLTEKNVDHMKRIIDQFHSYLRFY